MESVGIRKLKAHLSAYVAAARNGERVAITDRGVIVAQIVPVDGDAVLERLIDEGLAMPPRRSEPRRARARKTTGPISDLVAEQRG